LRRRRTVSGRTRFQVEELEGRWLPTTVFGLTTANGLVTFDGNNPAAVSAVTPVTGLAAGDTLEALERRQVVIPTIFPPPPTPVTLVGLARNGSQGRLYQINPRSGQATPLGQPFALSGNAFDLAATGGKGLILSDTGQELTFDFGGNVSPATAADPQLGRNVAAIAFTAGSNGPPALLGYRFDTNTIAAAASPGGPAAPAGGSTGVVAQSARDLGLAVGTDGRAFASLVVNGSAGLYQINPQTGAATLVGPIGSGADVIRDILLDPQTEFHFRPTVETGTPSQSVREDAGSVSLTVVRDDDGGFGTASVEWAITGGSAVPGVDFAGPTSGTLSFADGEQTKTVAIPLLRDGVADGSKTIRLALSNPSRDAALAPTDATATVTILDTDTTPQPGTTPPPAPRDVTPLVRLTRGRSLPRGRATRLRFTVTNPGPAALEGPLALVLSRLPRGVRLQSAAGVTSEGRPFVRLPLGANAGLGAGESRAVALTFLGPGKKALAGVRPEVVAGL
jgi:hypothetical protein